jgi:hypothetical protein
MRSKTLGLFAAGIAILLVAPAASAFHGSPYSAGGVAVKDGTVYRALVDWTGWYTRSYVVQISELSGASLVNTQFAGVEQNTGGGPAPLFEVFVYHGFDAATAGQAFDIRGQQSIFLVPQGQTMVYTGHYQDYQLLLFVAGPLL